jgi:hypothetical protein
MYKLKGGEVLRYRRERIEIIHYYSAELETFCSIFSYSCFAFLYHHNHTVFLTNQIPKAMMDWQQDVRVSFQVYLVAAKCDMILTWKQLKAQ